MIYDSKESRTNMYQSEVSYLSISHSITEHNDPVWKVVIDLVVVLESVGHAHLQIVSQLLVCHLEHTLGVVPGGGGGGGGGRGSGRRRNGCGDIE